MKLVFKVIFLLIFISKICDAQPVTWMRYYDYNNWSDYGHEVLQTYDGGYAFYSETSISDSHLKKNILLRKTNSFGILEFQKLITDSGPTGLFPTSFKQTNDSGFILAGVVFNSGFLIKTDKYGNVQWRRDYTKPGFERGFETIKITQDNGYICGGGQYILKTDSLGNMQWDSVYINFYVADIIQSLNGFYYVTNGNMLRKLNSTGGIVWQRDSSVSGRQIQEHPNGYFYLLRGLYLSKFDSSGNIYWKKNYENIYPSSYFSNICFGGNSDLVLCGYISDPYTIYPDCFLARVDQEGTVKNQKIILTGKKDYDYLESIYPTTDDGFICTGGTSFGGIRLYWNTLALKVDSSFNTTPIVGINNNNISLVSNFILYQNYPNPFNPVTTIKFNLGKSVRVRLCIYDISGKLVKTLINEKLESGEHETVFYSQDLSSGIYFYSLSSDKSTIIKKMILLK